MFSPGDLLRLRGEVPEDNTVSVVRIRNPQERVSAFSVDVGTPAIFLEWMVTGPRQMRRAKILVEGKLGWVYQTEIEVVSESW